VGETTKIPWTDATWSPVTGCIKISPGCLHCCAERMSLRFGHDFSVQLHPERLDIPLHWKKPRHIFVCSVSDLFHPRVPVSFVAQVFDIMAATPRHTYQILTKRPGRMAWFAENVCHRLPGWPENVWAGTSVESPKYLPRVDVLMRTPAKVRFVSCEPLLEPLDLRPWLHLGGNDATQCLSEYDAPAVSPILSWLIIGGESGPGHRPMKVEWVADIVSQCKAAGVPCFVKQASGPRPGMQGNIPDNLWAVKEMP